MLHAIEATFRQEQMQAEAQRARLVDQLGASGNGRPSNRFRPITLAVAEAARTPLSSGVFLAWGYLLKGARLGR